MTTSRTSPVRLALIGRPVSHSLSPRIFAELGRLLGRRVSYKALRVEDAALEAVVRGFRGAGFNVTIPHKRAVMPLLDALTPEARAIGAVNAVRFSERGLIGHNTDAAGFLDALPRKAKDAVVFGAGGAARAVAYALGESGARSVRIVARSPGKARSLALEFGKLFPRTRFSAGAPMRADVWVNATPLGMKGFPRKSPAPRKLACGFAFDLVYGGKTPFLKDASAAGIGSADGLDMLVCQALRGWEFWRGALGARRARLRDALLEKLRCL